MFLRRFHQGPELLRRDCHRRSQGRGDDEHNRIRPSAQFIVTSQPAPRDCAGLRPDRRDVARSVLTPTRISRQSGGAAPAGVTVERRLPPLPERLCGNEASRWGRTVRALRLASELSSLSRASRSAPGRRSRMCKVFATGRTARAAIPIDSLGSVGGSEARDKFGDRAAERPLQQPLFLSQGNILQSISDMGSRIGRLGGRSS